MNIATAHIRINKQHSLTALPGDGRQIRRHQRFSAVLSGARNHHNAVLSLHHGEIQTGSQPAYRFNKHISRAIDGQERHIRGFVFPATRERIFLRKCVLLHSHWERGNVARTGSPCASSCSESVIPRLNARRTSTVPIASIRPNSAPRMMINAFRGFIGSGA